jgi:hypothetical protein
VLPSLQQRYPEEAALEQIDTVAQAAGWVCDFAWYPKGRFAGLLCHCLRNHEILVIQVSRPGKQLNPWQKDALNAWRATGVAEVWECTVDTLDDVLKRLKKEKPDAR